MWNYRDFILPSQVMYLKRIIFFLLSLYWSIIKSILNKQSVIYSRILSESFSTEACLPSLSPTSKNVSRLLLIKTSYFSEPVWLCEQSMLLSISGGHGFKPHNGHRTYLKKKKRLSISFFFFSFFFFLSSTFVFSISVMMLTCIYSQQSKLKNNL